MTANSIDHELDDECARHYAWAKETIAHAYRLALIVDEMIYGHTSKEDFCARMRVEAQAEDRRMELAFVQGAKWGHHRENTTIWRQSYQTLALHEAQRRAAAGTLGKAPTDGTQEEENE